MGERYLKRRAGLSFGAPEEIEYERADAPTAKQARQMAWLTREIDRYRNGLWRLDEHDGIEGRIQDLEFLLFRATPHDKRITPLTDVEKSMSVFPKHLDIATSLGLSMIDAEGTVSFKYIEDLSTARPFPTP